MSLCIGCGAPPPPFRPLWNLAPRVFLVSFSLLPCTFCVCTCPVVVVFFFSCRVSLGVRSYLPPLHAETQELSFHHWPPRSFFSLPLWTRPAARFLFSQNSFVRRYIWPALLFARDFGVSHIPCTWSLKSSETSLVKLELSVKPLREASDSSWPREKPALPAPLTSTTGCTVGRVWLPPVSKWHSRGGGCTTVGSATSCPPICSCDTASPPHHSDAVSTPARRAFMASQPPPPPPLQRFTATSSRRRWIK